LKVDVEESETEVLSDKELSIKKLLSRFDHLNLSKIFEMLKSHGFKIINLGLHHDGFIIIYIAIFYVFRINIVLFNL
jgi:hypothetical protein